MRSRYALALGAVLMTVAGCSAQAGLSRPEPLSVFGNLKTIEIAPVLLAGDQIAKPQVAVGSGGLPNLVGEGNGQAPTARADLGTHAETQALRYSLRHPDLRIIMTIADGHYRIIARRSAGITKLADLKGKRIATSPPTSAGYFLHKMLKHAGLSSSDIVLVPLRDLSKAVDVAGAGEADAVAIWEPYSEDVRALLGDDAIAFSGEGIYRERFNLNTTAGKLSDPAKRQQIVAFVRAIMIAARAIEEDPAAAKALVVKAGGFTPVQVERAWQHHSFPAALAPDLLDVLVEEERWLADAEKRQPRSREQLSSLIDRSIIDEAAAINPVSPRQ